MPDENTKEEVKEAAAPKKPDSPEMEAKKKLVADTFEYLSKTLREAGGLGFVLLTAFEEEDGVSCSMGANCNSHEMLHMAKTFDKQEDVQKCKRILMAKALGGIFADILGVKDDEKKDTEAKTATEEPKPAAAQAEADKTAA